MNLYTLSQELDRIASELNIKVAATGKPDTKLQKLGSKSLDLENGLFSLSRTIGNAGILSDLGQNLLRLAETTDPGEAPSEKDYDLTDDYSLTLYQSKLHDYKEGSEDYYFLVSEVKRQLESYRAYIKSLDVKVLEKGLELLASIDEVIKPLKDWNYWHR